MNRIILFTSFLIIIWFFIPMYEKPRVLKNVLSEDECKHIQDIASKKLQTSTVSMTRDIDEKIRKSETAWLKASEDPVVDKLIRKCVSMTDRPLRNCEDLQVLNINPVVFINRIKIVLNMIKINVSTHS